MLVDVAWLKQHLEDPDVVVFDCRHDLADHGRGLRLYREGHIPGAYFAPMETRLSGAKTGLNGRHPLPEPADFAAFLSDCGVSAPTQIVAYDDVGGQYAARLWWLARWVGHTKVSVLDGGLPRWVAEGLTVTLSEPAPRERGSVVPQPNARSFVTVTELVASRSSGEHLVVDARTAERYRGETEPIDSVAGHIPGAVNRFFKANLNADLTMRPKEELRKEFVALLGDRRPESVVHQCGSGVTACANLLAMEYAGLSGSKLYPGSWSEWVADPNRPVARG